MLTRKTSNIIMANIFKAAKLRHDKDTYTMQHNNNFIETENYIAEVILKETIRNEKMKTDLQIIANKVIASILDPIAAVVSQNHIHCINDLPKPYQETIIKLAIQNVDAEMPFGAVLRGFKNPEEITCSMDNIKGLLLALRKCLSTACVIENLDDLLRVHKSIADLSFCYFECLPELHRHEFNTIKNMMWLTPEEMDARVLLSERGSEAKLAITFGLGRKENIDLVPAISGVGMNSAKSLFAGASMEWRLEIIIKQFDSALSARDALISKYEMECATNPQYALVIKKQLEEMEVKTYLPAVKKMQYYKIPLLKNEREPLENYVNRYKTTFEKLATLPNKSMLPLIANISRSTARTLIVLQDIEAFLTNDGLFNLALAQFITNGCAGFYIWGGNHSFTEVAEIYNRLLDYIAIQHPEQLQLDLPPVSETTNYVEVQDITEKKLPYYRVGDYQSFLLPSYTEKLAETNDKNTSESYYEKRFMPSY